MNGDNQFPIYVDWGAVWFWVYSFATEYGLKLVTAVALILGAVYAVRQFAETRRTNRLAHKPLLTFRHYATADLPLTIKVSLENQGQGTAIITGIKVSAASTMIDAPNGEFKIPKWDEQKTPVDGDEWLAILQQIDLGEANFNGTAIHIREPIVKGGSIDILEIYGANGHPLDKETHEACRWLLQYRLRIDIQYESIYGEAQDPARFGRFYVLESDPNTPIELEDLKWEKDLGK